MTILIFIITFIQLASSHENSHESQPVLQDNSKSLYSLRLENLDSFSSMDTSVYNGKKSLWVLFQPECKSCESQFRDLACLDSSTQQVAVGFWGNRDKLKKTVRFSQFSGKKLMSSPELEKVIQLKLTPTLLIVDVKGFIRQKIHALTSCQKIKKILEHI